MCSIMGYCGPCAAMHEFIEGFDKTISRGPDDSRITDTGNGLLAFHRLAIMGLTPEGMQPFELDGSYAVCNGEIYGFEKLKAELSAKYEFASGSDCEILLPMYREYGTDMFSMLDAEFAMIIYDAEAESITPIRTFAIGMSEDAIDLKYAKQVADYIGSDHTEVIMTKQQVLDSLEEVISILGTYDITTVRASMGMYLLCRWIHENTDIRVLLTGEISDELFGYKYTDFAPSAEEFQKESEKRIRELHMYDVLRADRCISANSLEARVPFGDIDFVKYVMAVDPAKKMNIYGKGKYLLRHAFEGDYLPYDILFREKAAFSDAVGHSMVDYLKEYAESRYTDAEFAEKASRYSYATPFTKESLLYREIFEKYYPGQAEMIAGFWMPNASWEGCDVKDPSARVLSNYGASGL